MTQSSSIIETAQTANELARKVAAMDSGIISIMIIDEPGHALGGYVQEQHKSERSVSKEVWRSVGFQQALFFSERHATDYQEVILVRKKEYEALIQFPEKRIILGILADKEKKSLEEIAKLIEKIRESINAAETTTL